jgi:hypothetical protein
MTTIKTKNYVMTTYEVGDKIMFAVTDKAVKNKKKRLNKLAWGKQYAIANKNGKFPVKFPHTFTVFEENVAEFIELLER